MCNEFIIHLYTARYIIFSYFFILTLNSSFWSIWTITKRYQTINKQTYSPHQRISNYSYNARAKNSFADTTSIMRVYTRTVVRLPPTLQRGQRGVLSVLVLHSVIPLFVRLIPVKIFRTHKWYLPLVISTDISYTLLCWCKWRSKRAQRTTHNEIPRLFWFSVSQQP